jgi:tellurite resistance protein TerC
MHTGILFWIGFHAAVLLLLALDLFASRRRDGGEGEISMREAAVRSIIWVALSLAFCGFIHATMGAAKSVEFITGYVIEYSLSADNLFVFVLIFGYFHVPRRLQHRVLLWGILGALAMRGAMIGLGVELVRRFDWILYGFGVFLVIAGLRMMLKGESAEPNVIIRACRKIPRVTPDFHGSRFLVRTAAGWMLTPLALALVVVDVMDLIFAVDSVPAVFAVTTDPFIVYTSNVCAILGLRSLYFLLAGATRRFKQLHYGLAAVLMFVGAKMLLAKLYPIPNPISLLVVGMLLAISVVWSLLSAESGR